MKGRILNNAIDLHVHCGPDIIPRKFDLQSLFSLESGKLRAIAIKNHSMPVISGLKLKSKDKPQFIFSVTLNHFVGGFNPEAIRALAIIAEKPIIVWFPTIHAKNFLSQVDSEVPYKWVGKSNNKFLKSSQIDGLTILDNKGKIKSSVINVLKMIKKFDSVLATGHLSWKESKILVNLAVKKIGIKKIIITHPIWPKVAMPLKIQKELADLGAWIEFCYSSFSINKIPISAIAKSIMEVGTDKCIITSDVGQEFSKNPHEALSEFYDLLSVEGLSEDDLKKMICDNPARLMEFKD